MLGTAYQKSVRASRKHQAALKAIYARRPDCCANCAYWIDGRFCGNPMNADVAWAEDRPTLRLPMVTGSQGCEAFDASRPDIREPDPDEAAEKHRYYSRDS